MLPKSLPRIVQQHADETAILAIRRAALLTSDEADLSDLAQLDMVLSANLSGLALAEDSGWLFAMDALHDDPDPSTVFAPSYLSVLDQRDNRVGAVLEFVAQDPSLARSVALAMCFFGRTYAASLTDWYLEQPHETHKLVGLNMCGLLGHYPKQAIADALTGTTSLHVSAMNLVANAQLTDLLPAMPQPTEESGPAYHVVHAATVSLLQKTPTEQLVHIAKSDAPEATLALTVCGVLMHAAAAETYFGVFPWEQRAADHQIQLAGFMGDRTMMRWLLEQSALGANPDLLAQSFRRMTGRDLNDLLVGLATPAAPNPFDPEYAGRTEAPDFDQLAASLTAHVSDQFIVLNQSFNDQTYPGLLQNAPLGDRHMIVLRAQSMFGVSRKYDLDAPAAFQLSAMM
ncbi:MAG: hypothetical protein AAFN94_01605 [Pseudomonadota bacterium]